MAQRSPMPDHLLAQNRYGRFCVPAESAARPAARAILAGEVWEPETAAHVAERGAKGDVVTAGAYFGDMLPAAAAGGNVVFAAEPNPVNFAAAQATLQLNGIENVRLYNAAFGPRRGTARLQVTDEAGTPLGGGSQLVEGPRWPAPGPVLLSCAVVAIDAVVNPRREVTLVHLDVEGYEEQALRGALRTIRLYLPDLLLETLPRGTSLWTELIALGYREVAKMNANTLLTPSRRGSRPRHDTS